MRINFVNMWIVSKDFDIKSRKQSSNPAPNITEANNTNRLLSNRRLGVISPRQSSVSSVCWPRITFLFTASNRARACSATDSALTPSVWVTVVPVARAVSRLIESTPVPILATRLRSDTPLRTRSVTGNRGVVRGHLFLRARRSACPRLPSRRIRG